MRIAFTFFIFTFVFNLTFCQEPVFQDINTAVKRLGADTFEAREQASDFLWRQGVAARNALKEAAKSKDPEIRMRALIILKKINSGVYPDTPKNLAEQLQRYNSFNYTGKCSLIDQLINAGDIGLKSLHLLIESQIADKNADLKPFKKLLKKKGFLSRLLKQPEKYNSFIESLLMANALGTSNNKDYIAWTLCNNKVKQRIPELEKRVNGSRGKYYLKLLAALYRADGRLTEAREAAEKSNCEWLAIRAGLEAGDFKSSLRIYKSLKRDKQNIETLGWIATLQRLSSNQKEFDKTIQEVIQLTDQKDNQFWYVAKVLMINELFSEAVNLNTKLKFKRSLFAFDTRPGEYLKTAEKFRQEKGETPLEYISFLFKHRQLDKAQKLFQEIIDKVLNGDDLKQMPKIVAMAKSIKHPAFKALLNKALDSKNIAITNSGRGMYGNDRHYSQNGDVKEVLTERKKKCQFAKKREEYACYGGLVCGKW